MESVETLCARNNLGLLFGLKQSQILGPPLPVITRYNMDNLPIPGHQVLGSTILLVPNLKRAYDVNMDTEKWSTFALREALMLFGWDGEDTLTAHRLKL